MGIANITNLKLSKALSAQVSCGWGSPACQRRRSDARKVARDPAPPERQRCHAPSGSRLKCATGSKKAAAGAGGQNGAPGNVHLGGRAQSRGPRPEIGYVCLRLDTAQQPDLQPAPHRTHMPRLLGALVPEVRPMQGCQVLRPRVPQRALESPQTLLLQLLVTSTGRSAPERRASQRNPAAGADTIGLTSKLNEREESL